MERIFSSEQEQIIIDSLHCRNDFLFKMYQEYVKCGYKDCQLDCLEERKKINRLLSLFDK